MNHLKKYLHFFIFLALLLLVSGCTQTADLPVSPEDQPEEPEMISDADDIIMLPETASTIAPTTEDSEEPEYTSAVPNTALPQVISHSGLCPVLYLPSDSELSREAPPAAASTHDLEFYTCNAGGGNYSTSIAPEGSDEWVFFGWGDDWEKSCTYSVENQLLAAVIAKKEIDFESETNGLYKIRISWPGDARDGDPDFEVTEEYHNIPIFNNTTRVNYGGDFIDFYPGLDLVSSPCIWLDQMEFCESCPENWKVSPEQAVAPEPVVYSLDTQTKDLTFYFCLSADDSYRYAIAPEGSEEWVALEDCITRECTYSQDHGGNLRLYQIHAHFENGTSGFWKIQITDPAQGSDVIRQWRNLVIPGTTTCLNSQTLEGVLTYPDTQEECDQWGKGLYHVLYIDEMEFCEGCPEDWKE